MQYEYLKRGAFTSLRLVYGAFCCYVNWSRRFRSHATEFPHDCTIMSQYGLELIETGFVLRLLRSERTVAGIIL